MLTVEDDELTRAAVQVALEGEGYVVCVVANGQQAERLADQFRPDLVVLDVSLPGGPDGYTIARRLRMTSAIPILFVTGRDEIDDRLAGFDAGGDDYLVKPFAMLELLARVRALLRRAGQLTSDVIQVGDLMVDNEARRVVRSGEPIELTGREYELLLTLARHPGRVLSKTQLLYAMGGDDNYDTHLVSVHMSALRRKLEGHGPRLIHTVRGVGFVLKPDAGAAWPPAENIFES